MKPTTTRINETPLQRQTRMIMIRREVAAGTYETPERLEAAVEALAADLEDRAKSDGARPRKPK